MQIITLAVIILSSPALIDGSAEIYISGMNCKPVSFPLVITDVEDSNQHLLPIRPDLVGAYPNPFNPQTTIQYSIPVTGQVEIVIFNMRGQLIKTLVNRVEHAGNHKVLWDGNDRKGTKVESGVYLCRFSSGGFVETVKLVLVK